MMSNKTPVLKIANLHVKRSRMFELKIPKLDIVGGRISCLAGANGSGKTTLLETITGLILPDKGKVRVGGLDPFQEPVAAKALIGFIPDDDGWIISELTADEYFRLLASIYKKAGVKHDVYAESLVLAERLLFTGLDQQLGTLSHGNRKKIQIIAAMAHRPRLLVVDELRNGLDPVVIKRAEKLLTDYRLTKAAILAATHDLWWAERLSDDLLIINGGQIILQDRTSKVKADAGSVEAKFMELYEK